MEKLFDVFNNPLISAGHYIPRIMKDLITENDDYESAYKLNLIYYKHLKEFISNPDFHKDWETPRVEIQMKKINRYFKNKTLPTFSIV